jgi:ubiquinone/menaquinone biosynthesis C-methylase UbiE
MSFGFLRSLLKGPQAGALNRSQYKQVWTKVSADENSAKMVVGGFIDEETYEATAKMTVGMLETYVGLNRDDVILEIGAGIGRVGAVLAPRCKEWIGADVSPNMLKHMRRRLKGVPNVRPLEISGYDLAPIADSSVDLVYCTVVFMHLDEWERYAYVREGMRVLKPGGRMLVDNVNLASDAGWRFFQEHCAVPPDKRGANISKTSTPQELETYFQRAGFEQIAQHEADLWIITCGRKSA